MTGRKAWGIVFIIIGIFFLLLQLFDNQGLFGLGKGDFWPMIILAVGVVFEAVYFTTKRAPGLLVPGGILTVIGLLFFFEVYTRFAFAAYTWPVYILSVAAGLFQLYLARKSRGLLVASGIVGFVGVLALAITMGVALLNLDAGMVVAALFIAAGLFLLARASFRRSPKNP